MGSKKQKHRGSGPSFDAVKREASKLRRRTRRGLCPTMGCKFKKGHEKSCIRKDGTILEK